MIPTEVGVLKKLKELDLSFNALDGSLPSEIGQCTNLEDVVLLLIHYNLNGSLPSEIGQCTNLSWLDLSFNSLDGIHSK